MLFFADYSKLVKSYTPGIPDNYGVGPVNYETADIVSLSGSVLTTPRLITLTGDTALVSISVVTGQDVDVISVDGRKIDVALFDYDNSGYAALPCSSNGRIRTRRRDFTVRAEFSDLNAFPAHGLLSSVNVPFAFTENIHTAHYGVNTGYSYSRRLYSLPQVGVYLSNLKQRVGSFTGVYGNDVALQKSVLAWESGAYTLGSYNTYKASVGGYYYQQTWYYYAFPTVNYVDSYGHVARLTDLDYGYVTNSTTVCIGVTGKTGQQIIIRRKKR